MKPAIATHQFVSDGQHWPDRIRRCQPPCGLPEGNRAHQVPDTSEVNAIDARRLGEREVET